MADAYVHSNGPTHNHGTNDRVTVNPKAEDIHRILVSFDLTSVPPSARIEDAELVLCVRSSAGSAEGHVLALRRIANPWDETSVTWDNQPADGPVSTSIVFSAADACSTWNVTTDVQQWTGGTSNYGWTVRDSAENLGSDSKVEYHSREKNGGTFGPFLKITYTVP
jgi:hypothetical protein